MLLLLLLLLTILLHISICNIILFSNVGVLRLFEALKHLDHSVLFLLLLLLVYIYLLSFILLFIIILLTCVIVIISRFCSSRQPWIPELTMLMEVENTLASHQRQFKVLFLYFFFFKFITDTKCLQWLYTFMYY